MNKGQRTPRILVTDASRGAAVASIRALSRAGYHVIAADSDPRSPGLASRYVKQKVVYACPKSNHRQFLNDILKAVEQHQVDMIVPITEQAALPLETVREQINSICKVPWAPPESLEVVRNKQATFQLAEKLHIPYPRTHLVHTVPEAIQAASGLGWPLVLKPCSSHTLTDRDAVRVWSVEYAANEDELKQKMQSFEGQCAILLQEYFTGAGVGVELLTCRGRPLCAFQHRRLREVPISGGASSLRRSDTLDPTLYAHACKLLKHLDWTGLAMVEFKQNDAGEARLMEINGRIWGSLPVAVAAGVDFPVRLCQLFLDGPPDPMAAVDTNYRVGVHVQNFQKEVSWIFRVLRGSTAHPLKRGPRRRDVFQVCLDLLRPSYRFDILSLRDPLPGLQLMANFVRAFFQGLRMNRQEESRVADRADDNLQKASQRVEVTR